MLRTKEIRKALSLILVLGIVFTVFCGGMSFAADSVKYEAEALKLKQLGLFKGYSDTNLGLADTLTREQGLTFMLRASGLESAVTALSASDVDAQMQNVVDADTVTEWARPYVAYAVKEGLTKGTDASTLPKVTFKGQNLLTGKEFVNFMLNAMGYSAEWDKVFDVAATAGVLSTAQSSEISAGGEFTRDSAVGIMASALNGKTNAGGTLAEALVTSGAITADALAASGIIASAPAQEGFYVMSFTKFSSHYGFFLVFSEPIQDLGADNVKFANDFVLVSKTGGTPKPEVDYTFRKLEEGGRVLSLTTIATQASSGEFDIKMKPKEEIQYIKNAAGEAPETFTGTVATEETPGKAADMVAAADAAAGGSGSASTETQATTAATTTAAPAQEGFYVASVTTYKDSPNIVVKFSKPLKAKSNTFHYLADFLMTMTDGSGKVFKPWNKEAEFVSIEENNTVLTFKLAGESVVNSANVTVSLGATVQYLEDKDGNKCQPITVPMTVEDSAPGAAAATTAAISADALHIVSVTVSKSSPNIIIVYSQPIKTPANNYRYTQDLIITNPATGKIFKSMNKETEFISLENNNTVLTFKLTGNAAPANTANIVVTVGDNVQYIVDAKGNKLQPFSGAMTVVD